MELIIAPGKSQMANRKQLFVMVGTFDSNPQSVQQRISMDDLLIYYSRLLVLRCTWSRKIALNHLRVGLAPTAKVVNRKRHFTYGRTSFARSLRRCASASSPKKMVTSTESPFVHHRSRDNSMKASTAARLSAVTFRSMTTAGCSLKMVACG